LHGQEIIPTISFQIIRDTIDRFRRKVLHLEGNTPWMRYREIDLINEILLAVKPNKCLEWGAGYSTLYFPNSIPSKSIWISIEHDQLWAKKIDTLNKNPNVKIFHIPPAKFPFTDPVGEGTYNDLVGYIENPCKENIFDFILVDGRARKECLMKCCKILSDRGVVVLHDANRKEYHEAFNSFRFGLFFNDYRTIVGGLGVGSNTVRLENVMNVEKNMLVWDLYNKYGKYLKL
jgi:predicted O-methyltransferase YrrM